ncbi:NADase-type glycan-binding domain-containing protein [Streptomyces chattanoogensis]|uniref:NADase-type glycan-binding domain-containing protein n=1 Tax=Streptomyces chattanoogensis TaxID=66876 RepID=UPI0006B68DE5|nr:zinc ribbon domain-containing protein [Streptomyces chattanoogensis]
MPTHHTTCPDCGAPAPQTDQSFCDSCGAFLRWDRPAPPAPTAGPDRTAGPAHPAPAVPAANRPEATPGPGAPHRPAQSDAATTPTTPTTPPASPPPTAPPAPATGDGTRSAAVPQQGAAPDGPAGPHRQEAPDAVPPAGQRGVSDTGIRALLVPVPGSSPTPPPEAPGGVLPGRPEAARPRVRTPQAAPQPDDGAPCRSCGSLNAPRRHFCRSCANPLTDTAPESAEGPYAGQRPRLHRDRTRWITRAVVAAVIAAAVVGGIFGGPPAARAIQDHFAKRVPVPATSWKASHSDAKHHEKLAFDSYSNTWWGTGYSGNSDGQYLEARFGQPTDLLNILITPGATARTPQAADPARPRDVDLIVTDSAGKQHLSHPRLNDGGVQRIDVAVRDAMAVRLVLHTAYGAADSKQVAVAELEFFGRSA